MPGSGAAWQRPACCSAEAVGGAAEVVDQKIVPVAHEGSDDADACAPCIDAVVEVLRNGRCCIGAVRIAAGVKMKTTGQRYAVEAVRGADRRPVVRRHLDDCGRRWLRHFGYWRGCRIGLFGGFFSCFLRGLLCRIDLAFETTKLPLQCFDLRLELVDLVGRNALRAGRSGSSGCRNTDDTYKTQTIAMHTMPLLLESPPSEAKTSPVRRCACIAAVSSSDLRQTKSPAQNTASARGRRLLERAYAIHSRTGRLGFFCDA